MKLKDPSQWFSFREIMSNKSIFGQKSQQLVVWQPTTNIDGKDVKTLLISHSELIFNGLPCSILNITDLTKTKQASKLINQN